MYATPAATPRRRTPCRCSNSTNGLSAIARKSEITTHVSTWRAIHSNQSTIPTASSNARICRIVRGRKRTIRSGACTTSSIGSASDVYAPSPMTLRAHPVERDATLPDGRVVRVRVGLVEDGYIRRRELNTVDVELFDGDQHLAAVNTVLDADQEGEALALAREIVSGLESGELQPTAAAIEPLADQLR